VVRALDTIGALVDDIEVRQPSLDDVFFALTGNPVDPPSPDADAEDDESLPELEVARS
jgi:hypothetical protein